MVLSDSRYKGVLVPVYLHREISIRKIFDVIISIVYIRGAFLDLTGQNDHYGKLKNILG
jgi:hypothetical protein